MEFSSKWFSGRKKKAPVPKTGNTQIPFSQAAQAQLLAMFRNSTRNYKVVPDERLLQQIGQQIAQAMKQQASAPKDADMENMSAEECGAMGDHLQKHGRWQEAEKWLLTALEKSEQADDLKVRGK
ncbi:MAG: hypothetical protein GY862_08060 [Gammaproteobacteria bacterium]|nr:hypothetical protein [Gammaproteobacteria bacterium]